MKSVKYISLILCLLMALTLFAGCEKKGISLLKKEESTTKEAFNQEEFDKEFYRTSVAESTEATTENSTADSGNNSTSHASTTATTKVANATEKISEITSVIISTVAPSTQNGTTKKEVTTKHVVDTKSNKQEKRTDVKYGVVKVNVVSTYYDVYSDGTMVQTAKNEYTKYDTSKYSATSQELLPEAKENKSTYSNEIESVVSGVNEYRTSKGQSALKLDDELSTIACVRATEMAYKAEIGSTRPDKSYYTTVYKDLDYKYEDAIELTGRGYDTASSAITAFQSTKDNTDIMESDTYKKIGVGVAKSPEGKLYWCIEFSN